MAKKVEVRQILFRGERVTVLRKAIKNLHLRIKPPRAELFVSSPYCVTDTEILHFLETHADWIDKHRAACVIAEPPSLPHDGDVLPLFGGSIGFRVSDGGKRESTFDGSTLTVSADRRLALRLRRFYTAQLQALTLSLLEKWRGRISFPTTELRFRPMTSRWGSCQPKKRIVTLNLRLAFYPTSCIEYVLVHELVHYLYQNHSPAFYAALSVYLPDWPMRKQLLCDLAKQTSPTDPFAKC